MLIQDKDSPALAKDILFLPGMGIEIIVAVHGMDSMCMQGSSVPQVIMTAYKNGYLTKDLDGYSFLSSGNLIGTFEDNQCRIDAISFYSTFDLRDPLSDEIVETVWKPGRLTKARETMHVFGAVSTP